MNHSGNNFDLPKAKDDHSMMNKQLKSARIKKCELGKISFYQVEKCLDEKLIFVVSN